MHAFRWLLIASLVGACGGGGAYLRTYPAAQRPSETQETRDRIKANTASPEALGIADLVSCGGPYPLVAGTRGQSGPAVPGAFYFECQLGKDASAEFYKLHFTPDDNGHLSVGCLVRRTLSETRCGELVAAALK